MQIMSVSSSIRDYQVAFVETMDFISEFESMKDRYYVIDKKVWDLYRTSFKSLDTESAIILPISEDVKCLETVKTVYDAIMKRSAKRNITLISVGGGIVQDITGFVASTLYRGINWIYVPTTLLPAGTLTASGSGVWSYIEAIIGAEAQAARIELSAAAASAVERVLRCMKCS